MMSAFFHSQPNLNRLFSYLLSYIDIRSVFLEIEEEIKLNALPQPQKKIPSKSPALLGLTDRHRNLKI